MPAVLHLTPQEVDTPAKRSKYTVAVVGCGHKGIVYANAFADAGFKVVCTDADASVVKKASKGKTAFAMPEAEAQLKSHINQDKISVTGELKNAVSQSDILVIAITAKVDEQRKNDYTGLVNTCKQVGAALHGGALVIYGGVAGVGFTEGTVKELLENTSGLKAGQDFGLAYSPLLAANFSTINLELTVAASDKISLEAAFIILKILTSKVKAISDLKTAEIAALFTIAKQDATAALTNEFAVFCENADVDYFKVLDALNLNVPCFRPTIAGEENKDGAYLLLEGAENLNVKLRLPALARQVNEEMVKHAVNLTQDALRSCGKTLRRGKTAVLGFSNPATTDIFVKLIEQKGAKVTIYDPLAKKETPESGIVKTSLNETVEGADCIIVLGGQEQFSRLNLKKLKSLMKPPPVVVDLAGKFDPKQVETEGFLYFGLGRGNDKK
jgi:nucleotide sugar dehydrogenase